nr:hypothetical protein [Tanacetum cinerariifolium]
MGFDMSKVKCYNCHMKGHFARECSYEWSFQAKEEPTNYAFMAFSSLSSSSDNEHVETSIAVDTPKPVSQNTSSYGKRRNRKACFVCKSLDHLIKDYDYYAKKMDQPTPRNHVHMANHKQYAPLTHQNPHKHMVPAAVLTQSKPVSITAVRPVSAAVSNIKAPVVSASQGLQGKWEWRPKCPILDHVSQSTSASMNLKGLIIMMHLGDPKNMSYLSNFKELNGGYVSFGGNPKGGKISGKGKIRTESMENNMYNVNLKNIVPSGNLTCLFAKATIDESNLWHIRLGHINFKTMNKLVKGNLVRGLPTKVFENDNTCVACKKGRQHRASCKTKPVSSIDQPLYRLHMDLFGPTFVKNLNKKSYCLVVTNDYSRFTWVFFLATKDETSLILKTFITGLENQISLRGIKREFSIPRTPQQNGIVKRKNRTLIEAARTMLVDLLLLILFWAEAVNTACYVQNRVLVTKPHNKTPYELLHGRPPSIGFMRPLGCPVTILNTLDFLGKFDGKVDEGFLVGYSISSKAFRVFNSRTHLVQETLHVNFLKNKPNTAGSGPTWLFDIDSLTKTMNYQPFTTGIQPNSSNNDGDDAFDGKEPDFDPKKPESKVNVSPSSSAQSRKQDDKTKKEAKGKSLVESFTRYRDLSTEFEDCSDNNINEVNAAGTIVSTVEQNSLNSTNTFNAAGPSNVAASLTYGKSSFLDASQLPVDLDMPELEDITYSDDEDDKVWVLVDLPHGKKAIGTKWVFMNKKDERGIVIRNKARLVAQGHTQEDGIDYEEVFTPVERIEAIRLFLAYASFMGFMVYQIDALYGLHQAPRSWYETLANYLLENGFQRGKIDQTLFIKRQKGDILLVQNYADDIIFGATNKDLCKSFEKLMKDKFQMSLMGELTFFLGLKVKQKKDGIFISQDKYVAEILRMFGLTKGKTTSTPIDTEKPC